MQSPSNRYDDEVKAVCLEFISTDDKRKQSFVEENSEVLLNPLAEEFLMEVAEGAPWHLQAKIHTFRRVLLLCRYKGISKAFAEHWQYFETLVNHIEQFIETPSLSQKKQLLTAYPDILSFVGAYALQVVVEKTLDWALANGMLESARMQKVKQNMILLTRSMELGPTFAFAEVMQGHDFYWMQEMETLGLLL